MGHRRPATLQLNCGLPMLSFTQLCTLHIHCSSCCCDWARGGFSLQLSDIIVSRSHAETENEGTYGRQVKGTCIFCGAVGFSDKATGEST